jgi:hypothetical protein
MQMYTEYLVRNMFHKGEILNLVFDYNVFIMLQEFRQPQVYSFLHILHQRDLTIKLKSCSGAEKKGL